MLSKNKIRFILSLQKKKVRDEHRLYIVEGDKIVREYLSSGMDVKSLYAKPEFISTLSKEILKGTECEHVSYEELKNISSLKTPHNAIAVVHMPESTINLKEIIKNNCLALDCIQDPGNMGTIIRSAAWFGFKNIVCSEDCVDIFNPKVIQASMGAMIHVNVIYTDLERFLNSASQDNLAVYGTTLDGESIYNQKLNQKGIILLGNESRGISRNLITYINNKLMIPKFTVSTMGIDSLNVGMAASIVMSEFARRSLKGIKKSANK